MRTVAYLYDNVAMAGSPAVDWGRTIDRTYADIAGVNPDRPELQALLADCEREPPDYLLVRQLADLGDSIAAIIACLTRLQDLPVQLVAIDQADEPIPSAALLTQFQALQTDQRRRRIQQGHARNRIKASPPPGKPPYGYKRGRSRYLVDRSTAPVVKAFFEQYLLFASLHGAVRYIAKKYGKKIAVSTGQKWLTNPVYRGDLAAKNGDVIADTHEAILSREEAAQIDRLRRRNQQFASRAASAPRSLSGLVTCATCRSPMTVTSVTTAKVRQKSTASKSTAAHPEYLYLRPTQCSKPEKCPAIAYEAILQATIDRICTDLPAALAGASLPDLDRIKQGTQATIAAKQQVLDQLPSLIQQGVFDEASAALRSYNLRSEIAILRGRLDRLPPVNLQATVATVSIPQFWLDLSEAERRFYFREFMNEVQIVRDDNDWGLKLVFIF
jgi:DNA invertase Pin-like site-specific DNA recombinase